MAICYHSDGKIVLNKETSAEFVKGIAPIFDKYKNDYDKKDDYKLIKDKLFTFSNYRRHFFVWDIKEYIEANVDKIDSAQLWFRCDDEDCFDDEHGFPFLMFDEVKDGKLYEQTLYRRLYSDWEYQEGSEDFYSDERQEEMRKRREEMAEREKKPIKIVVGARDDDDDDLPF